MDENSSKKRKIWPARSIVLGKEMCWGLTWISLIPAGRPSQERLDKFPRTALRHSSLFSHLIWFIGVSFQINQRRGQPAVSRSRRHGRSSRRWTAAMPNVRTATAHSVMAGWRHALRANNTHRVTVCTCGGSVSDRRHQQRSEWVQNRHRTFLGFTIQSPCWRCHSGLVSHFA